MGVAAWLEAQAGRHHTEQVGRDNAFEQRLEVTALRAHCLFDDFSGLWPVRIENVVLPVRVQYETMFIEVAPISLHGVRRQAGNLP